MLTLFTSVQKKTKFCSGKAKFALMLISNSQVQMFCGRWLSSQGDNFIHVDVILEQDPFKWKQ